MFSGKSEKGREFVIRPGHCHSRKTNEAVSIDIDNAEGKR
jgi:hypothetical protein